MPVTTNPTVDIEARRRAIGDLGSSLLVEAGAGTGKTSLLAARTTFLLLNGVPPEAIAAITFTEAAASELGERVHAFMTELRAGSTPEPLEAVLPDGLDETMLANLECACAQFDGLTATTIHGFCQIILADHAIEADVDPGAQVIDEDQGLTLFKRVFDAWLQDRLSGADREDDPILILTREDPRKVVELLWDIAVKRRRHRTAKAFVPDLSKRPDLELADAIDSFKRWCASAPPDSFVLKVADEFEQLGRPFLGAFEGPASFAELWRLAHPEQSPRMQDKSFELRTLSAKGRWSSLDVATAEPLREAFLAALARINEAYCEMLSVIGAAIASRVSIELDAVLADYAKAKRAAAVLDFDDLLELAVRLLRNHPKVRAAVGKRFQYLLVDEFQDTDPVQCDIIFRIGGSDHADEWQDVPQRPGALFLVGDPKQSLYNFRGAEIGTYETAKAALTRAFPDNLVKITSNFRTVEDILRHVNRCFEGPLNDCGQPGYVALDAVRKTNCHDLPCVAKRTVDLPPNPSLPDIRDAEAGAVADLCAALVGGLEMRMPDGEIRKVRCGDIGLLAPVGTDLWRYERALQERKLPFASRAPRDFYRRQEVQDLVALARLLVDARDTLALGAFLRGPLAGFTDEALLDATAALPRDEGSRRPVLSLSTPLEHVRNEELRATLATLVDLRRRIRFTTPSQLLHEAVERLSIRVILVRRDPRRASAANANVDFFLHRAKAYEVRGLRQFAQDISFEWAEQKRSNEGRLDAEGEAIDIVSIHGAKGLEWPIVIPINMASRPHSPERIVHRVEDDSLHWTIRGVAAPHLAAAMASQAADLARERTRLLYVCCTRARDLLIVPVVPATEVAYARAVDLALDALPELDVSALTGAPPQPERGSDNHQDSATFQAEINRIEKLAEPIVWLRPSDQDTDRRELEDVVEQNDQPALVEAHEIIGAGRLRGLVLHKLLEEVISEGLEDAVKPLERRAALLLDEMLGPADGSETARPDGAELARTVVNTLALREIAALRPSLVAEVPLYALVRREGGPEWPMAGRADALAVDNGQIRAAVDWKSDIAPTEADIRMHAEQLKLYLEAAEAPRGALVYASLGKVRWIER